MEQNTTLTRRLPPWSGPGAAPRGSACFPSCRCRCVCRCRVGGVGEIRESAVWCAAGAPRGISHTMMMMMLLLGKKSPPIPTVQESSTQHTGSVFSCCIALSCLWIKGRGFVHGQMTNTAACRSSRNASPLADFSQALAFLADPVRTQTQQRPAGSTRPQARGRRL